VLSNPHDGFLMPINVTKSPWACDGVTMTSDEKQSLSRSATHHLNVSKAFFRALCDAIGELSIKASDLYSFRRLLIYVLADRKDDLYHLDAGVLDDLCNPDKVTGTIRLSVRIDSRHNDLLRDFRDYAEAKLYRPVSVAEAVRVCIYAVTSR
jgi:hypothetical protein